MAFPSLAPARSVARARAWAPSATPRRGIDARARVGASRARARASNDLISGASFDDVVLRTWESRAAFFWPRFALECALVVALAAALPSSIGDAVRGVEDGTRTLGTNAAALAACALAANAERNKRTKDLKRLAKELALQRMVVIQRNRLFEETTFTLGELRNVARVAVVYGDAEKVERDLMRATPYRRRLEQSRILVVPVVERGESGGGGGAVADVGPGRWELLKDVVEAYPGAGAGRWLAWPTKNDDWSEYFRELIKSEDVARGGYLTISTTGLIRGSGVGSPDWSVLLSTFPRNRPGNKDDEEAEKAWKRATLDSSESLETRGTGAEIARAGGRGAVSQTIPRDDPSLSPIVELHEKFYRSLGTGDDTGMAEVWSSAKSSRSSALSPLVEKGARLDGWDVVLQPDRRPQGMRIDDLDITIEKGVATLTGLETVANGATLLCTQTFERDDNAEWMMTSHTTIPYGADTVAKIVLRCDANGCIAVPARAVASDK
ncbi:unnamed product [Ostreococcus tauri]|uniref:Unnamed product n=1 Tax=Ostreococcus tauri TaxID=70448 RepID=A0A090LZJ5_OSTTA|nr:unnamed product [Ostreococcus tauri]CEF97346.1 unnamed product [Ostreococcus tauri]|eukprot:XP_003078452.2 unnamed product [Ostreococcus tauri]